MFLLWLAGLGWSPEARRELLQTANGPDLEECRITLKFTVTGGQNAKFSRHQPLLAFRNNYYADIALLSREDVHYPPTKVTTSFNYLNYNYFCEQYAKVGRGYPLTVFIAKFFCNHVLFRTRILPKKCRELYEKPTLNRGFINIIIVK